MTIATVKAGIVTLQRAIPGIVKAYDELPRSLVNDMECPQFLTFVRSADNDEEKLGSTAILTTRDFLMWLLVKPGTMGLPGEGEAAVDPWITTVLSYFAARPHLGVAEVVNAFIVKDTGPKQLVSPLFGSEGSVYWGCEFTLRVTYYWLRTFADNE